MDYLYKDLIEPISKEIKNNSKKYLLASLEKRKGFQEIEFIFFLISSKVILDEDIVFSKIKNTDIAEEVIDRVLKKLIRRKTCANQL